MSSFLCEHCGASILDTPIGYITGCKHYPLPLARDHSTLEQLLTEAIELLRDVPYTPKIAALLKRYDELVKP